MLARQVRVLGVEIDLVVAKGPGPAIFVEVRGRTGTLRAPSDWLSAEKIRRLHHATRVRRFRSRPVTDLGLVEVVGPMPAFARAIPAMGRLMPLSRWHFSRFVMSD